MKQKLIKNYYVRFIAQSVLFLFTTLFLAAMFFKGFNTTDLWLNFVFLGILLVAISLGVVVSWPYFKDLPYVRSGNFGEVEGKVVGYKRIRTGGEPEYTIFNPIVESALTKEEIELKVEGTTRGKTYNFVYLRHTKLAVFEEVDTDKCEKNDSIPFLQSRTNPGGPSMPKTDTTKENAMRFLLDTYTFLSLSFSEQMKLRGCLGNGLTDDIAEDCDFAYLSYFLNILKNNGVQVDTLQPLMAQISDVFKNKSRNSTHYDPDFWTLGALKDSPIWDEQRKRAGDILVILKKV